MPHAVDTTLNYYLPVEKGGVSVYHAGTVGDKRRKWQARDVKVTNMRGMEHEFSLDKQGFQVVKGESPEKDFDDNERIREVYYLHCEKIIKEATGATKVVAAAHIVRKRDFNQAIEEEKDKNDSEIVKDAAHAGYIHVDQSYHGAETRIRDYFHFDDVQRLTTHTRWAIINVWRPIGYTATRNHLCMCDARSVKETDLLPVRGIFPIKKDMLDAGTGDSNLDSYYNRSKGETIELWYLLPPAEGEKPRHRWYYCNEMQPDEAILLKQFDSKTDGRAKRTPHSAFSSVEDHGLQRQSLEVRCFVFWEDQERS